MERKESDQTIEFGIIFTEMLEIRERERVRIEGKTPVFSIEKPGLCPQCERSQGYPITDTIYPFRRSLVEVNMTTNFF